jgi:hypothetical protein
MRVFVSYSHQEPEYLAKDSLLGFLRGLEEEGVEFWTDEELVAGDDWDAVIQKELARSDLALVLVSQAFLDSRYIKHQEIRRLLEKRVTVLPVILSACEWERHDWLASTHFLPRGGQTLEQDYKDPGDRKALFLELRKHLRTQIERSRQKKPTPGGLSSHPDGENPFGESLAIRDPARFIGRTQELGRLLAMLKAGSVALIGPGKIGKSSLLYRLAGKLGEPVVGPLDLQGLEDHDDFYETLAEELKLDGASWRVLRKDLLQREAWILLDEVDSGPGRCLDADDLRRFRSICQKNRRLRMVTVSRSPLREAFPDDGKGSDAYGFLPPFQLPPLPEAEARQLLDHPWAPQARNFDASMITALMAMTDRHPFRLQRAAYHRYAALLDPALDWRTAYQTDMDHLL